MSGHKTKHRHIRVPCPVPRPPQAGRPQRLTVQEKICGGHGPGETPGPIPNPEAKAWHGDGTAPDRVWESSTPPHHTYRKPLGAHAPRGFRIPETLTTQTHTPPQKHPGLLALMRPTSGTIPGRPRRRGRRETARRVPISAGNPENSTSVTVESRRPGLLPPVCCADGSPPLRGARNWLGYGVALHWLLLCITSPLNVALRRIKSCITIRRRFSVPLIKA